MQGIEQENLLGEQLEDESQAVQLVPSREAEIEAAEIEKQYRKIIEQENI